MKVPPNPFSSSMFILTVHTLKEMKKEKEKTSFAACYYSPKPKPHHKMNNTTACL